jgi:hypothetical protein
MGWAIRARRRTGSRRPNDRPGRRRLPVHGDELCDTHIGRMQWQRVRIHRLYRAIAVEHFILSSTDERLPVTPSRKSAMERRKVRLQDSVRPHP